MQAHICRNYLRNKHNIQNLRFFCGQKVDIISGLTNEIISVIQIINDFYVSQILVTDVFYRSDNILGITPVFFFDVLDLDIFSAYIPAIIPVLLVFGNDDLGRALDACA